MKQLTICLILAGLAVISTARAADCCADVKTVSAKKTKVKTAAKTAASCESGKSACNAKKLVAKIDFNVRGATLLAQR